MDSLLLTMLYTAPPRESRVSGENNHVYHRPCTALEWRPGSSRKNSSHDPIEVTLNQSTKSTKFFPLTPRCSLDAGRSRLPLRTDFSLLMEIVEAPIYPSVDPCFFILFLNHGLFYLTSFIMNPWEKEGASYGRKGTSSRQSNPSQKGEMNMTSTAGALAFRDRVWGCSLQALWAQGTRGCNSTDSATGFWRPGQQGPQKATKHSAQGHRLCSETAWAPQTS